MPGDLPSGLSVRDLEDDLHFVVVDEDDSKISEAEWKWECERED